METLDEIYSAPILIPRLQQHLCVCSVCSITVCSAASVTAVTVTVTVTVLEPPTATVALVA